MSSNGYNSFLSATASTGWIHRRYGPQQVPKQAGVLKSNLYPKLCCSLANTWSTTILLKNILISWTLVADQWNHKKEQHGRSHSFASLFGRLRWWLRFNTFFSFAFLFIFFFDNGVNRFFWCFVFLFFLSFGQRDSDFPEDFACATLGAFTVLSGSSWIY